MIRPRRKSEILHHRVPDFQLVYCGPDSKLLGQARADLRKADTEKKPGETVGLKIAFES